MAKGRGELTPKEFKKFILAGRAIVTIENEESRGRFTYRIKRGGGADDHGPYFVSVLAGPDNNHHYLYVGTLWWGRGGHYDDGGFVLDLYFRHSAKSRVGEETATFQSFLWVTQRLNVTSSDRPWPKHVKLYHEGRCGRCGKRLTAPESIKAGYGPECIQYV
jgi:hypothetical protein